MVAEKEEVKITGTVKKIRFKNEDNGLQYSLLKKKIQKIFILLPGLFLNLKKMMQ